MLPVPDEEEVEYEYEEEEEEEEQWLFIPIQSNLHFLTSLNSLRIPSNVTNIAIIC